MAKRQTWIKDSFVVHRLEMCRSLAWRALPWSARRFIDRLELEHMEHAGTENGNLVCTYDNMAEWGQDRRATASAIVYAEQLGFVRITQKGRHASGEHRFPSRYRLTYLPTKDGRLAPYTPPTDEWAQITTKEQLDVRLQTIERELAERRKTATARWHRIMERKEQIRSTPEKHFARRKNAPGTGRKNAPAKPDVPGCKNAPTSLGAELNPLSIFPCIQR
jgi:hypothetical protein